MNTYLDTKVVNEGRQRELDFAKTIAIVLMIFCHVGIYFYDQNSTGYLVSDLLGGEFAAPVFMVCLGIGTIYSRHNEASDLFARGLKTILFGYLLNFFREGLPVLLGIITKHEFSFGNFFYSMTCIDIMQFAGMAFITLALFKKLKLNGVQQFMIGLLCAGIGELLAWKSLNNDMFDAIFGLVWGTNEYSYFPLLNWLVFPTAGVLFGEVLQHCKNKTILYKSIFFIGLLGVVVAYIQMLTNDAAYYNNASYYFMGIKNVVFALCFPIVSFSICQFIDNKTKIGDSRIILFSSKYLNTIYCISWVLIIWARWILYDILNIELSSFIINMMMFITLILSYLLTKLRLSLKKKN